VAVVEIPGVGVVRATRRGDVVPPGEVVVTVRPEKIVFAEEGSSHTSNVLTGTVEDVIFIGEMRRYQVRLGGGQSLILKRQNRAGVDQFGRGAAVAIGWHVADSQLV
jgi:ABC-type Fe3+/spermidine/putrescine transport system ATPase subunit